MSSIDNLIKKAVESKTEFKFLDNLKRYNELEPLTKSEINYVLDAYSYCIKSGQTIESSKKNALALYYNNIFLSLQKT